MTAAPQPDSFDSRGPLAVAIGVALALGIALVWSLLVNRVPTSAELLADPELKREVVRQLVQESGGAYDSHPDASVARVMQPGIVDGESDGFRFDSNAMGLRERDWVSPKPAGRTRIVLLGDSFVFGFGVGADERFGARLERALIEFGGFAPEGIECLNVGVPSWNIAAATQFLRRQLESLVPDLVVHLSVANDLDDAAGVRGFGTQGRLVPARPEQADTVFLTTHLGEHRFRGPNLLNLALDHTSRARFEAAARSIDGLQRALEPFDAPYVLVAHWGTLNAVLGDRWLDVVSPERFWFVPAAFATDPENWVHAKDYHWNAAAHETVARALYRSISDARLLGRELAAWGEPSTLFEQGDRELRESTGPGALASFAERFSSELVFPLDSEVATKQAHGGVADDGTAGPAVALALGRADGRELVVQGRFLPDRALLGATIRVDVDGRTVGRLSVMPGESFDVAFDVEAATAAPLASVELFADDFVYRGDDRRRCVAFQLERVAFRRAR
ncbi:MAG: SGNH/GDSL hydrolase family protein [Planctomycetota bacterium]